MPTCRSSSNTGLDGAAESRLEQETAVGLLGDSLRPARTRKRKFIRNRVHRARRWAPSPDELREAFRTLDFSKLKKDATSGSKKADLADWLRLAADVLLHDAGGQIIVDVGADGRPLRRSRDRRQPRRIKIRG